MGTPPNEPPKQSPAAAEENPAVTPGPSEAKAQGGRLLLKFIGGNKPELDRIEFQWSRESRCLYWQQGDDDNPMTWTKVPQALALIFLDYLGSPDAGKTGPVPFCQANSGGLVISLANAISNKDSRLHALFVEWPPKRDRKSVV